MSDKKQTSDAAQTGPGVNNASWSVTKKSAPSPSPSTAPASKGGSSQSNMRGKQGE